VLAGLAENVYALSRVNPVLHVDHRSLRKQNHGGRLLAKFRARFGASGDHNRNAQESLLRPREPRRRFESRTPRRRRESRFAGGLRAAAARQQPLRMRQQRARAQRRGSRLSAGLAGRVSGKLPRRRPAAAALRVVRKSPKDRFLSRRASTIARSLCRLLHLAHAHRRRWRFRSPRSNRYRLPAVRRRFGFPSFRKSLFTILPSANRSLIQRLLPGEQQHRRANAPNHRARHQ